jgi:hypothetical protein
MAAGTPRKKKPKAPKAPKQKAPPRAPKQKALPREVLPFPDLGPEWEFIIDPNAPPVDENVVLDLLADMLLDMVDPDGADPGPVGPG